MQSDSFLCHSVVDQMSTQNLHKCCIISIFVRASQIKWYAKQGTFFSNMPSSFFPQCKVTLGNHSKGFFWSNNHFITFFRGIWSTQALQNSCLSLNSWNTSLRIKFNRAVQHMTNYSNCSPHHITPILTTPQTTNFHHSRLCPLHSLILANWNWHF